MSELILQIGNVPITPDTNKVTLYPKNDKRLYLKDDTGTEVGFSPPASTDALAEGSTNLYFTNERAQDAVGNILTASTQISFTYSDVLNQISASLVAASITDTEISAAASIALSKLASVTSNRALISSGLGKIDVSSVTSTELGYLSGVSSSIQTQFAGKEPTITTLPISKGGTNSSTALTSGKAMVSTAGAIVESSVTSTELGYLSGVTSSIQTQLNAKFDDPTGTTSDYIRGDGSIAAFPTFAQADRLVTTVRNQTGSTIAAGAVVYINGSSGNDPTVTPALADSDINSAKTYGLTTAAIPDNTLGTVVASGRLQNINTSSYLAGASLYLSPTVPGGYTTTKPSAPNHLVAIGFVIRSHPTQGEIEVKVINGFELAELHDVAISSPVTGQSLYYNSVTDLWSNQTPPISITGQMAVSLETAVVALTDAATIAINASLGNTFTVTLGGNRTLGTPTNPVSGQKIIVRVTQDGTGGRTLSYSSGWNLGTDFVGLSLSTAANATDYIGAIYNAITSKWDVVSIMRGY